MVSKQLSKNAVRPQSTPEARAKAVATNRRRRAEKLAAKLAPSVEMSLDAIPDRPERKKYERKVQVGVSTKSGTAIELLRLALKLLEES